MKRYLITSEETCPQCLGCEIKESPIVSKNYSLLPDDFICDECSGTGIIYTDVELSEALGAVNIPQANFDKFESLNIAIDEQIRISQGFLEYYKGLKGQIITKESKSRWSRFLRSVFG